MKKEEVERVMEEEKRVKGQMWSVRCDAVERLTFFAFFHLWFLEELKQLVLNRLLVLLLLLHLLEH